MKKRADTKIFDSKNPDLKSYSKVNNFNKNYHENGNPNYFDEYEDDYRNEFSEELFARNSFRHNNKAAEEETKEKK